MVASSSAAETNPAYPQFTGTAPKNHYHVSTVISSASSAQYDYDYEYPAAYMINSGTCDTVSTFVSAVSGSTWSPTFTYTGTSSQSIFWTSQTYQSGTSWQYGLTTENNDQSWSGTANSGPGTQSVQYNQQMYVPGTCGRDGWIPYYPMTSSTTILTATTSDTEGNNKNDPTYYPYDQVTLSDLVTLSNQYPDSQFTSDVLSILPPLPSPTQDYGANIAGWHLASDSSSFSVTTGSYYAYCSATGTTSYKFEWYEVFQPDNTTQSITELIGNGTMRISRPKAPVIHFLTQPRRQLTALGIWQKSASTKKPRLTKRPRRHANGGIPLALVK